MNKNKKRTASGLILAGTSLASIAGQAAINVNAEGSIFGNIKNFFTQSKNKREGTKVEDSLKLQKQKIIDLKRKGKLVKNTSIMPAEANVSVHWRDVFKVCFTSVVVSCVIGNVARFTKKSPLMLGGLLFLSSIVVTCYADYVSNNNTFLKEVEKARANVKGKIKEDMLNKQYTLKEFEDIVKDDEECSEFIRQLLVLERNPDEIDDEGYKLLDNGELEDAKEVLRKLFLEVNSADKIKDLKKLPLQRKEKLLKVVKPLSDWLRGEMPKLFGEGDYFNRQKDIEFRSKVFLLENAIDDYLIVYSDEIEANDFIDFICCDKDVEGKTYTKGYAKHSFIHITREFLEKSGVDVKLIDDDLLLDSVKSLFKNLRNFDLLKFNNSKKDVRELAAKGFCDKFSESQKKLRDNVFSAIEHYFKEIVKGDKTKKYTNGNGKKESLEDRMDFVEQRF